MKNSQLHNINSDKPKHLRLLGWLFLSPARLHAYREKADEKVLRSIGAWLVGTLIWLPLFILSLATVLGTMPVSSEYLPCQVTCAVLGWTLTGCLGMHAPSGRWRIVFRGTAHGLVFLIGFYLAHAAALSVPLTQGWFEGGPNPVALDATFIRVFGSIIVVTVVVALGLAVDVALGMGVDVAFVVAASLGLGLGVVTVERVSSYIALALAPVVVYGVVAILKQSTCMRVRMRVGATVLRIVASAALIFSLSVLVWLCLLKGWQAFGWHSIG